MKDENSLLEEDEENDYKIEEFCKTLNSQDYSNIESARDIRSNFESLNEIIEPLNETKIYFENPELKINKTFRSKLQIITPNKTLEKEDENLIKDIKCFQTGYEDSANEVINLVENVKKNVYELSGSVKSLIDAVEKTKIEYYDTLQEMITPLKIEADKIEKVDQKKISKEKKINYNDMKSKLDKSIRPYDQKLAQIIKDTQNILSNVKENINQYIDLLNSLDEPINTMLENLQKVFDLFEEKGMAFINIIYNYKTPEEKKQALTLFREIQDLHFQVVLLISENAQKLKKQEEIIKAKKLKYADDLQNIRTNNINLSSKLKELHDEEQNIMKEINDFLKFLNFKKEKYYLKELKGLQLYRINKQILTGTENLMKANKKIEADLTKLKKFVEEKDGSINEVFTLELAFIMDITGSMGGYLDFCKKQILSIINKIMEDSTVMVKLGFIGYRDDYDSRDEYIIYPELTKEVDMVKNFISQAKVGGGGDCEDMAGGLNYALKYKWKSRSRFALLIADAPCHGIQYHGLTGFDSYSSGDSRYKIDELVKNFAEQNINLMCLNIKDETKNLYNNFKLYYKNGQKKNSNSEIIVRDFNEDPINLADIIVIKAKELYSKRHEIVINDEN